MRLHTVCKLNSTAIKRYSYVQNVLIISSKLLILPHFLFGVSAVKVKLCWKRLAEQFPSNNVEIPAVLNRLKVGFFILVPRCYFVDFQM